MDECMMKVQSGLGAWRWRTEERWMTEERRWMTEERRWMTEERRWMTEVRTWKRWKVGEGRKRKRSR
jgi:hypothetical protein